MFVTLILLLAGALSAIGIWTMMMFLMMLARENELPDLEDVQV